MTEDTIDLLAAAGFVPADEAPDALEATGTPAGVARWIATRFDAWQPLAGGRHAVVSTASEGDLLLTILTAPGATIAAEARFDLTDDGRAMFAAAVDALPFPAGWTRPTR